MNIGCQIKLKGISKRGKERIKQHGVNGVFILINKFEEGKDEILVESLNNTWCGQKWLGWLELGKDVEIIN